MYDILQVSKTGSVILPPNILDTMNLKVGDNVEFIDTNLNDSIVIMRKRK